jgi:predicted acyltransferase
MLPGWDSAYFEGGPCKVPGTFSWYLASTGLVGMLLGLFIYWIDIKSWHRSASLLVYTGQNPMLAYMAARSLLVPILLLPVIQTATAQRLSLDDWIYGQMFDYLGEGYSPYWKLSYGMLKVLCLSC